MSATVDLEWLARICRLPGVSGSEGPVRDAVWERLRPLAHEAWIDPLGNLVLTRGWRDGRGPRTLLCAHLDEVGLIVTGVDPAGLLRFDLVGGIDVRLLPGCAVRIGPEGIPGAVTAVPVHLTPVAKRRQAAALEDLRLDIGARDAAQARRAVELGACAVFAGPAGPLGQLFRAKALDDRAGICVLAAALEALADTGRPLAVAFTVQEEIGTRGAAAVADRLAPDQAVIVETTTAVDLPGIPGRNQVTRLGRGPVLTALDGGMVAAPDLTASLVAAAQQAGLAYQWKQAASGGTDAARFQASGARAAVVSVPARYLHAPASVLDPRDLQGAADLVAAWFRAGG